MPDDPKRDDPALSDTLPSGALATKAAPRRIVPAAPVAVGARLGERYTVTRLLGQGGMGAVYLAVDEVLEKEVALKFVHRELAGGTDGLYKLRDEVRLAQKVTHRNVCRTYDLEEVEGHFLVKMEYVDGETLSARINRDDRVPLDDALAIARDIATGLQAAHAQGVVHRDLKPQNVLLEKATGRVVLMDFGIARATRTDATDGERPVGTPEYMAPEQARSRPVDGRTDLYALGCVLYHMLCGEVPYPASNAMACALRHITDPIPDPREVRPDLPSWVVKVIRAFLAKEPEARPPDAEAALALLQGPRRRNWRVIGTLAAAAACAATAAGIVAHRWLALTTIDCAAVAERRLTDECVAPLDATAGRALTFRLTRQRGRTLKVERLRNGHPAPDDDGVASWEYLYDTDGDVKETVARDRRGAVKLRWLHAADLGRSDRRDAQNDPLPEPGTDVTVRFHEYDPAGREARVRFANVYGSPRADRRGAFGYQVTVDERGLATALLALGADGKPAPTPEGLARIAITRDGEGHAVEERTLASDGRPLRGRDGTATVKRGYDGRGNLVEESYLGPDGKPAFCADGYAAARAVYDGAGERVQLSYFGVDGAPALARGGFATVRDKYDGEGDLVEESWYGVYGEPTLGAAGYAKVRLSYDGRAVEEAYFDAKDRPAAGRAGWARMRRTVDEAGRTIEEAYFAVDARPAIGREGFAARRLRYDEHGRVAEEALVGVDGRPTLHRDGWAARRFGYDERGHLVEEALFGADDKPARHRDGWARVAMKYDERGERIEKAYLDADGRPARHAGGYSSVRAAHDARGRLVEETLLGAAGERVAGSGGWSRRKLGWDEADHLVEEQLIDARDRRAVGGDGWSIRRARFDAAGHQVEERTFDAAGAPVKHAGCASWQATFDEAGNRVERRCFDESGRPVRGDAPTAVVRWKYDARGHAVEEAHFAGDGAPAATADGWATLRTKVDPWGRAVEQSAFGADAAPVAARDGWTKLRLRWDEQGRLAQRDLLGPDGKPVVGRAGWATAVWRYDRFGDAVEERFFGADGKPMADAAGAAGRLTAFDDDGKPAHRVDFDLHDQAIAGVGRAPTGTFAWTREGGRYGFLDGSGRAIGDQRIAAELASRADALRAGFAAERFRAAHPGTLASRGVLLLACPGDCGPLRPGDLLLAFDGRPLERPLDLVALRALGHAAELRWLRDGAVAAAQWTPADLVLDHQ